MVKHSYTGHTVIVSLVLGTLLIGLHACKEPPTDSQAASIDNLAAGGGTSEFALNHCTAKENNPEADSYIYKRSANDPSKIEERVTKTDLVDRIWDNNVTFVGHNKTKELEATIKDVLMAVPMDILGTFELKYKDHKNQIYVHNVAPKACLNQDETKGNTDNEVVPFACYSLTNEAGEDAPGVYLGPGKIRTSDETREVDVSLEKAIRHGLMKGMVFYYTFVLRTFAEDPETDASAAKPILALGALLEKALERDLTGANTKGVVGAPWEDIKVIPDLKWVIISHTLDSAFCSSDSRRILATCYPNTFQVFSSDGRMTSDIKSTEDQVAECVALRRQLVSATWDSATK